MYNKKNYQKRGSYKKQYNKSRYVSKEDAQRIKKYSTAGYFSQKQNIPVKNEWVKIIFDAVSFVSEEVMNRANLMKPADVVILFKAGLIEGLKKYASDTLKQKVKAEEFIKNNSYIEKFNVRLFREYAVITRKSKKVIAKLKLEPTLNPSIVYRIKLSDKLNQLSGGEGFFIIPRFQLNDKFVVDYVLLDSEREFTITEEDIKEGGWYYEPKDKKDEAQEKQKQLLVEDIKDTIAISQIAKEKLKEMGYNEMELDKLTIEELSNIRNVLSKIIDEEMPF